MRKPKAKAGIRLRAPKNPTASETTAEAQKKINNFPATNGAENSAESLASDWRNRLNKKAKPQNQMTGAAEQSLEAVDTDAGTHSELDAIIKMVTENQSDSDEIGTADGIGSSQSDESENARPLDAGVENDATDIGKEQEMQTAVQYNPVSDERIVDSIDLRDEAPTKDDTKSDNVTALLSDNMASLFGPVIEDEVKGVRNQIRELIQCELQGELGQRFSRNLRIVIRREIAAAVDDQFDRV